MKIIHTGDWHIGKIVNEFSMLEDQEYILNQLISVIENEKPDALIIAGDIFDRSIPPVDAVELVDKVFNIVLLDLRVPIFAIAGNHDSAERLSFASRILTNNGLHIAGSFDGNIRKVILEDGFGPVNFYLIPYSDPRTIRNILQDNEISTHDDAMKKLVEKVGQAENENKRSVMITHGYITYMGGQADIISESERPLSIGGTDIVNSNYFNSFSYTALGHLHAPQRAGADNIRYSGSLLKYSFSEVNQKKGINVVEIDGDGNSCVKLTELKPKRDMRIIKGPLEELLKSEVYKDTNTDDYIYAILTDKGELIDPISKLRSVYPNVMGLTKEIGISRDDNKTSASEGYKSKSKLELFQEFYSSIQGEPLSFEELKIIEKVIGEVETGGYK
ncbi:exonuclease SbcCD subunit D [Ruminiclostridium cellulolyticum]|uniref:Nuclease SbcCD subunit D n=1 Tax=Ruminiclostridium cellulolyticum (strain ATCC 35319 / DSM 5812 / JCM 6584 / H10) TaxID=394503 RepID=B8I3W2_RUMCH|nr:exonuclease SbcCD subunit D [Ruminiclostridium cellulolyticum]ACL74439.1 nuclease SbcCD, D subunit [Ruminiclostridium cellulolyticum H10]